MLTSAVSSPEKEESAALSGGVPVESSCLIKNGVLLLFNLSSMTKN